MKLRMEIEKEIGIQVKILAMKIKGKLLFSLRCKCAIICVLCILSACIQYLSRLGRKR